MGARKGKAVIYAHSNSSSTELKNQTMNLRKLAKAHKMEIVRIYTDFRDRKQYQKLLSDAYSSGRDFNTILVAHSSKCGRSIQVIVDEYMLNKIGVKIMWPGQLNIDTDTPVPDWIRKTIQTFPPSPLEDQSRRIFFSQRKNAKQGCFNGGRVPDGYVPIKIPIGRKEKQGKKSLKVKLALDSAPGPYDLTNQPRWKWIKHSVDTAINQHKGLKTIARELYAMGWRQKNKDEPLGSSHIRSTFRNPIYTGHTVWNRRKWYRDINGNRRHKMNTPGKWIWSPRTSHPAVFSLEEFRKLIKTRSKTRRSRKIIWQQEENDAQEKTEPAGKTL